jgi:hypothetical protein
MQDLTRGYVLSWTSISSHREGGLVVDYSAAINKPVINSSQRTAKFLLSTVRYDNYDVPTTFHSPEFYSLDE